ncbi:MAG: LolA family protein [Myxococcales bacterium]|jgi:outer membrane lipoprotein carrier protein
MIANLLLSFALSTGQVPAAAATAPTTAPSAAKEAAAQAAPAPKAAAAPMAADVKKAVDQMQKFYEETRDFEARFEQRYTYKSFGRTTKASGKVRFLKSGASMRWDYLKPNEKVFVIAANKVFAYDKEAKQVTVSSIETERLSASITFLWGQGKLEREFDIQKASRDDLKGGIALELTPKKPDPRFQRIFFLIDAKTFAVKESIVVDPDGSENRVAFLDVRTNTGFGADAFQIAYPPDTQVIRMDDSAPADKK